MFKSEKHGGTTQNTLIPTATFRKIEKKEVSTFQVHWMVVIGLPLDRAGQSYPGQTISGLQMAQTRYHIRLKNFQWLLPGKS